MRAPEGATGLGCGLWHQGRLRGGGPGAFQRAEAVWPCEQHPPMSTGDKAPSEGQHTVPFKPLACALGMGNIPSYRQETKPRVSP